MKSKIVFYLRTIAAALVLSVLYGTNLSRAQVIIEEEQFERASSEKFFGKLGVSSSNGSSHAASYQSLEIGYDTPFHDERGRLYFSGIGRNTSLKLDLEYDDGGRPGPRPANTPEEMTLEEKESDFDVRDAFVQYNLPGNLVINAGRRRVAWGQFDLFSPVNLALPLSLQTAEPVPSKVNTLVPQDQIAVSWFPTERMEVHAYYFFSTQIDYLIENFVEGGGMDEEFLEDGNTPAGLLPNMRERSVDRNDLTDHEQYAARVLFHRNWGTLGITYHKGSDSLSLNSDLATVDHAVGDLRESSGGFDLIADREGAYNVRRHPDLPESTNYGLEVAIPRGDWVWKFEILHQQTTTDLEGYSSSFSTDSSGAVEGSPTLVAFEKYLNEIFINNESKLYVPVDRTIIGLGVDSDRDKWRLNLGLFIIGETYDEKDNELIQLEEEAGFDNQRGNTFILPAINVARYFGGEKQKELGVAGGFLGSYAGVSVYYTANVGDNFRWVASGEAFSSLRDQLVTETSEDADRYDLADDVSVGIRAGLIYTF